MAFIDEENDVTVTDSEHEEVDETSNPYQDIWLETISLPIQVKEASENNFKPTFSDKSEIKTLQNNEVAAVRKIKTAPSPVISMYCNNLVVHLTLDCGAEAPCITPEECTWLGLTISPPSQLAKSVDHTKLKVLGETGTSFTRGPLKLEFEAERYIFLKWDKFFPLGHLPVAWLKDAQKLIYLAQTPQ